MVNLYSCSVHCKNTHPCGVTTSDLNGKSKNQAEENERRYFDYIDEEDVKVPKKTLERLSKREVR
jgi:hypothetical protein